MNLAEADRQVEGDEKDEKDDEKDEKDEVVH